MVLLDTCTLIWLASEPTALSATATEALERSAGQRFVSAISAFELAIKAARGKLRLKEDPEEWFRLATERYDLQSVPVDALIALRSVALPNIHNDPADRMIVATAALMGLDVLTPDRQIARYPGIRVIW